MWLKVSLWKVRCITKKKSYYQSSVGPYSMQLAVCGRAHEKFLSIKRRSMRSHHVCMGKELEGNDLFGGHRNPEQRSRPRMPLSSGWERPFRRKAFLKKGFPVRLGSERCSGGQKDMSVPKQDSVEVRHTDPVGVTYSYSFSSDYREIIMFYFCLISAIERLICNAFMFLRMMTTSGPNMKRHIINSCI